ncbi:uncharacterized protein BDZ83DRAFT_610844 [Colletotrichum acutatum]|uniref:Uncharacterized protein n=1 Tax=Glomerella acutata TaxID=27357 RepID=A0AAD8UT57_GLOAC|nr:uncharacterized protein BDZ83DRAFT_610844 [Colletotrichum acutatum]KAK1727985.1 hypothetical protein BDZ83DRAFT_610844 [Colletotrichum acutatum]
MICDEPGGRQQTRQPHLDRWPSPASGPRVCASRTHARWRFSNSTPIQSLTSSTSII